MVSLEAMYSATTSPFSDQKIKTLLCFCTKCVSLYWLKGPWAGEPLLEPDLEELIIISVFLLCGIVG